MRQFTLLYSYKAKSVIAATYALSTIPPLIPTIKIRYLLKRFPKIINFKLKIYLGQPLIIYLLTIFKFAYFKISFLSSFTVAGMIPASVTKQTYLRSPVDTHVRTRNTFNE